MRNREAESSWTRVSSFLWKKAIEAIRYGSRVATPRRIRSVIHNPDVAVGLPHSAGGLPRPQPRYGLAVLGCPRVATQEPSEGAMVAAADRSRACPLHCRCRCSCGDSA